MKSMKTRPSTTKSMGSGMNYTAAGQAANSAKGFAGGKVIQAAAGGPIMKPDYFSGRFINAAGGRTGVTTTPWMGKYNIGGAK